MGEIIIDGMNVAHQKSGHAAPGPPAVSGIMPPTAAGAPPYTPAPFMYIAKASALHKGSCKRKTVQGARSFFVIKETVMDVEHPGNMPSKPLENTPPNGSDLVTKVACGQAKVMSTGQSHVKIGNVPIAIVGADVVLNIPTDQNTVHQSQSKLLDAGGLLLASLNEAHNPCRVVITGDPVAIASGDVYETVTDFELPGMVDLLWTRHYASGRREERGPLGRGGWRHGFEARLEVRPDKVVLHEPDGARVEFPPLEARGQAHHRGRGLRLTRALDTWEVWCIHDRRTRRFTPAVRGGAPVLEAVLDRFGNAIRLEYEEGRLARLLDTAKREVRLDHDERGRITRVAVWSQGAEWQSVTYEYSDEGDLAGVTNALGHRDGFEYDGLHRLVRKKLRSGAVFQYDYHPEHGRCIRSSAQRRLHNIELAYGDTEWKVTVSGNPQPVEYTFGPKGDLVREAAVGGAYAYDYAYDDDQLLTEVENAAGEKWELTHDELGLCTKRVDPGGHVLTYAFHDGLPVEVGDGDAVTRCTWDARGAPISTTLPSGVTLQCEFDRFGRATRRISPEGTIAAYQYDEQHNLVAFTDARGATTRLEYDAMGRVVAETDPLGRTSRTEYDALGRPVRHVMRDGTVIEQEYDAGDNLIRSGDGHGVDIKSELFGTGKVARRTFPDGQSWEMAYDVLERLREIKNPKQETYEFHYDRAGRLAEEKTFDGQTIRYAYSRRDLISRIDYDDETWLELEHDERGDVVKRATPHGTATFERDAQSLITKAVLEEHDGSIVVEIERDARGLPVAVTQNGRRIEYEHDAMGRVLRRVLPNGETTRYHWDACYALLGVEHEGEKILLQRDALGREVRRHVYSGSIDVHLGYNDDDRLSDQYVTAPGRAGAPTPAVLVRRKWTYGAHARVASILDSRRGMTTYRHDALGRLLEARRNDAAESFLYDPAGSLVAARRGEGPDEPWAVRAGNLLVRTDDARYEYDARRRRRRKIHLRDGKPTGEVTEYLWDCQNQLREVILPERTRVLFKYDAFGRRVRKVVIPAPPEGGTTEPPIPRVVDYLWDVDELAMEIDSGRGEHGGGGERVFVHQRNSFFPLLQREGGQTFFYLTDHLGLPKELFDTQGRVAWAGTHSAWGKVLDVAHDDGADRPPRTTTPFRLLGHYADEETGLAYAYHRYFDPDTARWLSSDPLGFRGGNNLFAFDGSPTEHVDPLGLYTRSAFQSFLEKYADKRKQAQQLSEQRQAELNDGKKEIDRNKIAASASSDGKVRQSGGKREEKPAGPWHDRCDDKSIHAEEKVIKGRDGLPVVSGEAVGAGIPHCANCTNDIINSGNVPATSIRPNWSPSDAQLGLRPGNSDLPPSMRESVPGRNEVPW